MPWGSSSARVSSRGTAKSSSSFSNSSPDWVRCTTSPGAIDRLPAVADPCPVRSLMARAWATAATAGVTASTSLPLLHGAFAPKAFAMGTCHSMTSETRSLFAKAFARAAPPRQPLLLLVGFLIRGDHLWTFLTKGGRGRLGVVAPRLPSGGVQAPRQPVKV
jgi:hypothetical protein